MNDAQLYSLIGRPVVTEKTTVQREDENKVVFRVKKDANKIQIRQAIEKLFSVKVLKVNTTLLVQANRYHGCKIFPPGNFI